MEEKSITHQQSLDLIARMLRNTQDRFERGMGTPFLIFGYLTLAVSIAVWSLLKTTGDYHWQWLWFAIPVIGAIFYAIFLARKPKKTVTTFIDRAVSQVWYVLGSCCLLVALYVAFSGKSFPILMVVSLLMFSGEAITGGILRLRYIQVMGLIGIALSFAIPFLSGIESIGLTALSLIAMVIPGHIMNAQARKRDAETPQIDGHV